ncbi:hypothetical protein MJO28_000045 [Puccinia striiformis f. sp. tritici]|uniref:Uncharacterized protein n=1 Tax=Puccinia striiformis f. sp. tritici TaxID=168172 RepID=A0ACC0EXE7_9BASI|nr:hypothetical protein MJO28_000045 [Puccinia striiformis f. sp. tritici]
MQHLRELLRWFWRMLHNLIQPFYPEAVEARVSTLVLVLLEEKAPRPAELKEMSSSNTATPVDESGSVAKDGTKE